MPAQTEPGHRRRWIPARPSRFHEYLKHRASECILYLIVQRFLSETSDCRLQWFRQAPFNHWFTSESHRLSPSDVSQTRVANRVSPMQSIWCTEFLRGWNCYSRPCIRPLKIFVTESTANMGNRWTKMKRMMKTHHFPISSRFCPFHSFSQIFNTHPA